MRADQYKTLVFRVIRNAENEYSLWLADREVPPGWSDKEQITGSSKECLAYIREQSYRMRQAAGLSQSLLTEESLATAAYA